MVTGTLRSLELKGICGVCALDGTCDRAEQPPPPVAKCERFEPDPDRVCEAITAFLETRIGGESDAPPRMGLCVNCEHRSYCTLPAREGGIWHCEEYA